MIRKNKRELGFSAKNAPFQRERGRNLSRIVPLVFQNISRLAIQYIADGFQGGKTDGTDMAVFLFGQVDIGHTDFFGKFVQRHFSVRHDTV